MCMPIPAEMFIVKTTAVAGNPKATENGLRPNLPTWVKMGETSIARAKRAKVRPVPPAAILVPVEAVGAAGTPVLAAGVAIPVVRVAEAAVAAAEEVDGNFDGAPGSRPATTMQCGDPLEFIQTESIPVDEIL